MNKPTMLGYSLYPPTTDITCGGFLFNNNQWKKNMTKNDIAGELINAFLQLKGLIYRMEPAVTRLMEKRRKNNAKQHDFKPTFIK